MNLVTCAFNHVVLHVLPQACAPTRVRSRSGSLPLRRPGPALLLAGSLLLAAAPPELTIVQHSVRLELASSVGGLERRRVVRQGDNALSFFSAVTPGPPPSPSTKPDLPPSSSPQTE